MAKVVSLAILMDPIGSMTTTTSSGMGAVLQETREWYQAARIPRPGTGGTPRLPGRRKIETQFASRRSAAGALKVSLDSAQGDWDISSNAAGPVRQ
ncbi:hypothetical protein D9M69_609040 [compost metagenome]